MLKIRTKEQEKRLRKIRNSFIKSYGPKKWISILHCLEVLSMTQTEIEKKIELSRFSVRYWIKKIESCG